MRQWIILLMYLVGKNSVEGQGATWSDVCDPVTNSCGLHSNNIGRQLNDLNTLLTGNPYFGPGWTIYINPFPNTCVVGNCTPGVRPAANPNRPDTERYIFMFSQALIISIPNITIRSYYDGVRVLFMCDDNSVTARLLVGTGYNSFFLITVPAVSFIDMEFRGYNGNYSRQNYMTDLVPIQYTSASATKSRCINLVATTGAIAVVAFTSTYLGTINVDQVYINGVLNVVPYTPQNVTAFTFYGFRLSVILLNFVGVVVSENMTSDGLIWMLGVIYGVGAKYGDVRGAVALYNATMLATLSRIQFGWSSESSSSDSCTSDITVAECKIEVIIAIALVLGLLIFFITCGYGVYKFEQHVDKGFNDFDARSSSDKDD